MKDVDVDEERRKMRGKSNSGDAGDAVVMEGAKSREGKELGRPSWVSWDRLK
jgi:hypothetical protein